MKKLTVVLGAIALICAVADLLHGQHNGDAHRFYIHIAELISFVGFLGLLEIQACRLITARFGLDRWLASVFISMVSFLMGFALFGLAGGSAHGDGGPLAIGFALMGCTGAVGIPISVIGSAVITIRRRRMGSTAS